MYIYSHGIGTVFEEVGKYKTATGNGELVNNFWRAFVRLMENCTSYQTVFQEIEKKHIQNNVGLKHTIEMKEDQFREEKKELNMEIHKLTKSLEDKQNKL